MQSTSWEMPGWMKYKLESRLPGEISVTSDMQICGWHHPYGRKWRRTKEPLDQSEKRKWKSWLKAQHSEILNHGTWPIYSWEIDGETVEIVSDFIVLGSKITADGDCSHEIKRCLLLGRKFMTNLDSIFKSRGISLPSKVCLVKAMVFPVVMYGCESWTVKKAECQRINAFEMWCWRRHLRVSWIARRSNQSILNRSVLGVHWKDWCWSWYSNTFATWCKTLSHW